MPILHRCILEIELTRKGVNEVMGEIDITQNRLEDHADVFADICNVLLFNGESVILPGSLKETGRTSQVMANSLEVLYNEEK